MDSATIIYITIALTIFLIGGFIIWWYFNVRMYQIDNPTEAEGEIVEIIPMEVSRVGLNALFSGDNKVLFHPVVRFRIDGSKLVRFRNRKGFDSATELEVGKKVKLVYSKHNPLVAKIVE